MPSSRIKHRLKTGPKLFNSAFFFTRHADRYAAFGVSIMRRRREVMDAPLRNGICCCKQLFHAFAKRCGEGSEETAPRMMLKPTRLPHHHLPRSGLVQSFLCVP